jgi:MSHA pilin protein MshD
MCSDRASPGRAALRRPGLRQQRRASGQRGFTLPEAILAIVVIGIGLTGLLLAFGTVARSSADPVVTRQMLAIAQEMMEEVTLKPYTPVDNAKPADCARDTYNDISDYAGYASRGICNVVGEPIKSLSAYNVEVAVKDGDLAGVPARQIVVTVSTGELSLSLTGWRTDYGSP